MHQKWEEHSTSVSVLKEDKRTPSAKLQVTPATPGQRAARDGAVTCRPRGAELGSPQLRVGVAPSSQLPPSLASEAEPQQLETCACLRLLSVCGWRVLGDPGGPGSPDTEGGPCATRLPRGHGHSGLPGAVGSLLPVELPRDPLFWGVDHWGLCVSREELSRSWSPLCSFSQGSNTKVNPQGQAGPV